MQGVGRVSRTMVCAAVALSAACLGTLRHVEAAPADDTAATPALLGVNVAKGYINLGMLAEPGSEVTFYEILDTGPLELGHATTLTPKTEGAKGIASIPAIPWRCDRVIRHFLAREVDKDGKTVEATNDARTPDCKTRFTITAPKRVEPGETFSISVKDRWQIGDQRFRLCIRRPKGGNDCSALTLEPKAIRVSADRKAGNKTGLLDIDLVFAGMHQHQKVGVGVDPPKQAPNLPVVLAAGDSMMEGVDTILAQQLGKRYKVVGQPRPGTGVSKELGKSWTTVAKEQAAKIKPTLTVLLLGGNDAFPMSPGGGQDKIECCSEAWQNEYLRRITIIAEAYLRNGRGKLVYCLLPPPKRADLKEAGKAVNNTIRRVALAHPEIQLVPLNEIFGPEYKETVNGQRVRDPDGLHLSLPGQRLAVKAMVAAIHKAEQATPTPGAVR